MPALAMERRMSKDLIEYLQQHLAYEIEMLNGTYVRIPRVKGNDNDAILKNALIESFCLHARALFEFFRKESARHEYTEAHYQFFNRESSFSQKLNTQIAHLVFEGRTTEEEEKIGARDRF